MNLIDTSRQVGVFSPDKFGDQRIDVIGAGASGSHIALSLAKLGLEKIHVWDFDDVESHNVCTSRFQQSDIGRKKVEALRDCVRAETGLEIQIHPERVDGTQKLGKFVFLLTDTMASRKEIWQNAIRFKVGTKLMIETRMGASEGRIYVVNPNRPAEVRGWEETLYEDADAEVSACGTSLQVGPTAEFLSGLAVWQLIRWLDVENGVEGATLDNEILFWMRTPALMTRRFDD